MHLWFYVGVGSAWLVIIGVFKFIQIFEFTFASVVFGFFAIGWLQYILVQAMHESVHRFFIKRDKVSWWAALLTTYPVGLTRNYTATHLNHHWNFGDPTKDPDAIGYHRIPQSKVAFFAKIAQVGLLFPALWQFFTQNVSTGATDDPRIEKLKFSFSVEFASLVFVQTLILLTISAISNLEMYFILWVLPLMTVVKTLSLLRLFAEHSSPHGGGILRSFRTTFLRGLLLGPFGFSRHGEHHLQMTIPFEKLNQVSLHAGDVTVEIYEGCHLTYLWSWVRALPWVDQKKWDKK